MFALDELATWKNMGEGPERPRSAHLIAPSQIIPFERDSALGRGVAAVTVPGMS